MIVLGKCIAYDGTFTFPFKMNKCKQYNAYIYIRNSHFSQRLLKIFEGRGIRHVNDVIGTRGEKEKKNYLERLRLSRLPIPSANSYLSPRQGD